MFDLNSLVSCFALLLLGGISWFTYKVYIWPYYTSPLRNIPGPPSDSFLYGNFKRFFVEEAGEPYLRWAKEYGSFVKYNTILNKPILSITDEKILKDILLSKVYEFRRPEERNANSKRILGHGLFLAEGETHKRQRKMMNPAFIHHNIKDMVPTFIRVGMTLKGLIENKVNKGESRINLTPYLLKTTMDIIGAAGFNHEFNSLTSPSELAEAYDIIMNDKPTTLSNSISILSYYIPFIRKIPINVNNKFNYGCDVIEREAKKIVDERYQDDKLQGKDLLSLLISINKTLPIEEKITDDELKYQIMTFLLAGHETTSNGLSWALYSLAKNPHIQDLLREELVKAFPDKSKFNPTFDEINSLEYLNCIIKETLRLYPPVTVTLRSNIEDQVFGEHFIPKNTPIIIPFVALHRLPSIWGPTADEFVPKRWLDPPSIQGISNYNYLPFSTGLRSCIGSKLALNEIKILLSLLVRNFVFQTVEGFQIKKKVGFLSKVDPHLELIVTNVEA